MKYCTRYNKILKNINKFDEIIIKYDKSKNLLDFLKEHNNQRIIIDFEEEDEIEQEIELNKIKDIINQFNYNIVIRLAYFNKKLVQKIKNKDLKFFILSYVNNWDTIYGLINIGVSDIYIVEELGFELNKIAPIIHNNNIIIRTIPNIAQSAWKDTPDLKKFFIRPEDVNIYEDYIDVLEFLGENSKYIDTLYDIYAIDKQWYGEIGEIISGIKISLSGPQVIPEFAEMRTRCGKRCLKGGNCNWCEQIQELSNILKENNLKVQKEK